MVRKRHKRACLLLCMILIIAMTVPNFHAVSAADLPAGFGNTAGENGGEGEPEGTEETGNGSGQEDPGQDTLENGQGASEQESSGPAEETGAAEQPSEGNPSEEGSDPSSEGNSSEENNPLEGESASQEESAIEEQSSEETISQADETSEENASDNENDPGETDPSSEETGSYGSQNGSQNGLDDAGSVDESSGSSKDDGSASDPEGSAGTGSDGSSSGSVKDSEQDPQDEKEKESDEDPDHKNGNDTDNDPEQDPDGDQGGTSDNQKEAVPEEPDYSGIVILLDPGHGGIYPGACDNGLVERDLNLKVATYLAQELREYGMTVCMTRETNTQLSTDLVQDLRLRVQKGANVGADYVISLHFNSSTNTSANGAICFTPVTEPLHSITADMAGCILSNLSALGLRNGGTISTWDAARNREYYAINRYGVEYGIPSLIVEHCFISNAHDASFADTDAELRALAHADALGIASYFGIRKKKSTQSTSAGTEGTGTQTAGNGQSAGAAAPQKEETVPPPAAPVKETFQVADTSQEEVAIRAQASGISENKVSETVTQTATAQNLEEIARVTLEVQKRQRSLKRRYTFLRQWSGSSSTGLGEESGFEAIQIIWTGRERILSEYLTGAR